MTLINRKSRSAQQITAIGLLISWMMVLTSCATQTAQVQVVEKTLPNTPMSQKCDCNDKVAPVPPPPETSPPPKEAVKPIDYSLLKPAKWEEIDGVNQDNLSLAWPAWMQSCAALNIKPYWKNACAAARNIHTETLGKPNAEIVTAFFKQYFSVYKTTNIDGSDDGLITGYYEPLLKGSRTQSAQYPFPLYTTPPDLVTVELDSLYPELKYKRLRGRLVGNKLVPYYNRAEIDAESSPIKGKELIYVDDLVDAFFLQIQGSGLIQLENGEQVHVGYADQNGHTYNSIGRLLIERGELTAANASMNGIKKWAQNNLPKLRTMLNNNPSYVFFRELPAGLIGPLGALGVPLLGERTVAVDPKFVPLGAPVFISTTEPNSEKPLKRLMMAQDTGGAIKGGVRADFYWGSGFEAGTKAGAMKQAGKLWVLLPNEFILPNRY